MWFNPWTGEELDFTVGLSVDSVLTVQVPPEYNYSDVAFIINSLGSGGEPAELALTSDAGSLINNGESSLTLTCIVKDANGFISSEYNPVITFAVDGPGSIIGGNEYTAYDGYVKAEYMSGTETGEVKIYVASPGLIPDTVTIELKDHYLIDDFENYPDNSSLGIVWRDQGGTDVNYSLAGTESSILRMYYQIGNGSPPHAGIYRELTGEYSGANYLRFWFLPDGSNRELAILLNSGINYWQYNLTMSGSGIETLEIPLDEFLPGNSSDPINVENLTKLSFVVLQGEGNPGTSVIYFDDISLAIDRITGLEESTSRNIPDHFMLYPNYPNPFNPATTIQYSIPFVEPNSVWINRRERNGVSLYNVTLKVYDVLGSVVATLVDEEKLPGIYQVTWNASNLPSGVYILRMQAGNYSAQHKMMLIK
jgi:hypothetical protein